MNLDITSTRPLNDEEASFVRRIVNDNEIATVYISVLNKIRASEKYIRIILKPGARLENEEDADASFSYIDETLDSVKKFIGRFKRMRENNEKVLKKEIRAPLQGQEKKDCEMYQKVVEESSKCPYFYFIFVELLFNGRDIGVSEMSMISKFNNFFFYRDLPRFFILLNNFDSKRLNDNEKRLYRFIIRPIVIAVFNSVLYEIINSDDFMRSLKHIVMQSEKDDSEMTEEERRNSRSLIDKKVSPIFQDDNTSIFRELFVPARYESRPLQTFMKKDNNRYGALPDISPVLLIYESVQLEYIDGAKMNYTEDVVMRFCTFFNIFPRVSSFVLSPTYVQSNLKSHLVGLYYDMLVKQERNNAGKFNSFIELEYFKYWIIIMNAKNSVEKSVPLVLRKSSFIEKYYPEYHAAEHFYFDMIETKEVNTKYKNFIRGGLPLFFLDKNQKEVLGDMVNAKTWKWTVDMIHYENDRKTFYDGWPNYHFRYEQNYKQYLPGVIREMAADKKMEKSKEYLQEQYDFTFEKWAAKYPELDTTSLEQKYIIELLSEDVKKVTVEQNNPGIMHVPLFSQNTRLFQLWADSVLHYVQYNPLVIEDDDGNPSREFRIVIQHAEIVYSTWYLDDGEPSYYFKFLSTHYPGFLFCYYNDFDASKKKKDFFLNAISTFAEKVETENVVKQRFQFFSKRLIDLRNLDKPYWVKGTGTENDEAPIKKIEDKVKEKRSTVENEIKALEKEKAEIEPNDNMQQVMDSLQYEIDKKNEERIRLGATSTDLKYLVEDFGLHFNDLEEKNINVSVLRWLVRIQAYIYSVEPYHFRFHNNERLLLFSVANQYILERQNSETFPEFMMRNSMQLWYNSTELNLNIEVAFNYPYDNFNPSPFLDWLLWSFRQERDVLPMLTQYSREDINRYLVTKELKKEAKKRGETVEEGKKEDFRSDSNFIRNVITELTSKSTVKSPSVYYRHLPKKKLIDDFSYKISFPLLFYLLEHIDDLNINFPENIKMQLIELKDAFLTLNIKQDFKERIAQLNAKKINFGLTPEESNQLDELTENIKLKQEEMTYLVTHYIENEFKTVEKNTEISIKFYGIRNNLKRQVAVRKSIDDGVPDADLLLLAEQKYRDMVEMQGLNGSLLNFADNIQNFNYVFYLIGSHYMGGNNADNVPVTPAYKIYFIRNLLFLISLFDYWLQIHQEVNVQERIKRVNYILTLICYRLIIRELAQAPIIHHFNRTKQPGTYKTFSNFMQIFKSRYGNTAENVVDDITDFIKIQQNEVARTMIEKGEDKESTYTRLQVNSYLMYRKAEYLMPFLKNVSYMYAPDLFQIFLVIFNADLINKFDPTNSEEQNQVIFDEIPFPTGWLPVAPYNVNAVVPPPIPIFRASDLMDIITDANNVFLELSESRDEPSVLPSPTDPFMYFEPHVPSEESSSNVIPTPVVKTEPAESSHSEPETGIKNTQVVDLVTPEVSDVSMGDVFKPILATPERSEVSQYGNNPFESSLIARDEIDPILNPPPLILLSNDSRQDDIVLPRKRPITDVYSYVDLTLEPNKTARIASILRTQHNVRLYEYTKENPPQLLIAAYHPHWYENMSPDMKKVFREHPTVPIVLVSDSKVSAPLHKDLLTYRIPEVWVC